MPTIFTSPVFYLVKDIRSDQIFQCVFEAILRYLLVVLGLSNWSSRVYCWIVARSFGIKLANLFKSNVKGLIESSFTVSRTVRQYLLVIISKAVERSSNKEITPRRFWPLSETAIPLNPKLGSIALKSSAGYWKNLMRDVWKTLHLLASWFHKNLGC